MTMYGIKTIENGQPGPWVELAKSMRSLGGVIVFSSAMDARSYASNAMIRGVVEPYADSAPTVEAVHDRMGWSYR